MPEAFAKFRDGTPGSGASHASYITRMSALDPDNHCNPLIKLVVSHDDSGVESTLTDSQNDRTDGTKAGGYAR